MLSKLSQYECDFEDNINEDMLLNLADFAELDMQDLDMNWSDMDQELTTVLNIGQSNGSAEANVLHSFAYEDALETSVLDVEELFNQLTQPMVCTSRQPSPPAVEEPINDNDIERELAALVGDHCISEQVQLAAPLATEPPPLPMETVAEKFFDWSVVEPLSTSSSVLLSRLCFGRLVDEEIKINNMLEIFGYQHWSTPPNLDSIGDQHAQEYIFNYTELPEHIKQMINMEMGRSVPDLFNTPADCRLDNAAVSVAESEILCVCYIEPLVITFNSCVVPSSEKHSGFNVFGEATRVSLAIHNTEIVLDNATIVALTSMPDTNTFLFSSSTNIYVLSGRLLLDKTQLPRHVQPITNIYLLPNSST